MSISPISSWHRLGVGLLAAGIAAGATAADSTQSPSLNSAAVQAAIAARGNHGARLVATQQQTKTRAAASSTSSVVVGGNGFANPSRAYPPSCLADNLPTYTTGADPYAQQGTLPLVGSDSNGNSVYETDTFTLWRVPCSGGVSAVLLELDRPSSSTANYVFFPNIGLPQSSGSTYYPRLPNDPNTVFSDTAPAGAIYFGNVYVLDYVYGDNTSNGAPDYNQAFTLNIDNLASVDSVLTLSLPAYNAANFGYYPSASNPLEISGYVSGPWYQAGKSGEGMYVEVYDNGDQATRTFTATWYTFDSLGQPFWLFAQAALNIGQTSLTNVPVAYITGGGFAGNFTSTTQNTWGTMNFNFPDCNTMSFSYSGSTPTISTGPGGSGSQTWTRVASISGLVCQ